MAIIDNEKQYIAFISYSHSDKDIVKQLHIELENYVIPKDVRYNKFSSGKLGKFVLDSDEFGASSNVNLEIQKKLDLSEYLIVVCSLEAAKSDYVNAEVEYFKQKNPDKILLYLLSGEPNAKDEKDESLPNSLLNNKDNISDLAIENIGYAGADLRNLKEREKQNKIHLHKSFNIIERRFELSVKEKENLRMVTGLISLPSLDLLINREKHRKLARFLQKSLLIVFVLLLTVYAVYQYNNAKKLSIKNNQITIDKGKKAFKNKNWKKAYLLFKKSIDKHPTLEAKIGLKLSSENIIPELLSFKGEFGKITKIIFAPDNRTIAIGGENGKITLLDIYTGKIIQKIIPTEAEGDITDLIFTKDNKYIISSSKLSKWDSNDVALKPNSAKVKICNIKTASCEVISKGDAVRQLFLRNSDNEIIFTRYTTDEKGNYKQGIFVWDRLKKELKRKIFVGRGGDHKHLMINNDEIISIFYDRFIIHNINTGALSKEIVLHSGITDAKMISKNTIAFYYKKYVYTYNFETKYISKSNYEHSDIISTLLTSPDEKLVVSGSNNGITNIWTSKNNLISSMQTNTAKVNSLSITNDGKILAISGDDKRISFYKLKSIKDKDYKQLIKLPDYHYSIFNRISPNQKYITYENMVFNTDTRQKVKDKIFDKYDIPYKIRFSPTSTKVVYEIIGQNIDRFSVLDLENNITWGGSLKNYRDIDDIAINPIESNIAIAVEKEIYLISKVKDKHSSKKISFESFENIKSINFSKDGKKLFILTPHFIYNYSLKKNQLTDQWYFGLGISQHIFVHKILNSKEYILLKYPSLLYEFYLCTLDLFNSLDENISLLDLLSLLLDGITNNTQIHHTNFLNPPFKFEKILAQSDDGKFLITLDSGDSILIHPNTKKNPIFIAGNNKKLISASFGKDFLAISNINKIDLFDIENGKNIINLPYLFEHLSIKNEILFSISYRTYQKKIDLSLKNLVQQSIYIPFDISVDNKYSMKTSRLLAKSRSHINNEFKKINAIQYQNIMNKPF